MVSRRRFRVAVLTVALIPLLALAPAASAAERTFKDRSGDASPQVDITRLVVKNSKANAYVTVKMPKFKRGKLGAVLVGLQPRSTKNPGYTAVVGRSRTGGAFTKGLYRNTEAGSRVMVSGRVTASRIQKIRGDASGDEGRVRCKKLNVTWRKASISISVPQRCMGSNRARLNVQAITIADIADKELEGLSDDELVELFERSFDFAPQNPAPHWTRYR